MKTQSSKHLSVAVLSIMIAGAGTAMAEGEPQGRPVNILAQAQKNKADAAAKKLNDAQRNLNIQTEKLTGADNAVTEAVAKNASPAVLRKLQERRVDQTRARSLAAIDFERAQRDYKEVQKK